MNESVEEIVFQIIIYSGEAKAHFYNALEKIKEGKNNEANQEWNEGNECLNRAHDIQSGLLSKEANGEKHEFSIIFVHAQDHLMTTISERNLIEVNIELLKKVKELEEKIKC
ncbi:PTS lactose/cellobiose transporter subunit IIA [Clostridium paraputrificum]|uniref:PTS lactose/cellobiose transporter subunit IIA n=1 Tax=Clostridium paraputrificum TaxID=29363 RepID=UPI0006662EEB|nr:PTS lactose/cellobiose transporter subunit IIA [Clostridium paraputrificum]MDB2105913.1 PTS lactose/cellobiose transporter subunit IIA [Clostridium paraputrificum]MDB2112788.1 PTS lactose/cellobiose transporter subunit IIA [Clostridium paraputrificum]